VEVDQEATPAPLDTHILFAFSSFGRTWNARLTNPSGETIPATLDTVSPDSKWFRLKPKEHLSPDTTYTVTLRWDTSSEFDGEDDSWTFTTGDTLYSGSAPQVNEVSLFEVNVRGSDDCVGGNVTWDREYAVRVPEALVPEPFIYELIVEQDDDELRFGRVSYDWGTGASAYTVLNGHTTSMRSHPCVRVKVTDVIGRTVESSEQCDTIGFLRLNESESMDRELFEKVDQWEELAEPQGCNGCSMGHTTPQRFTTWMLILVLVGGWRRRTQKRSDRK
jgi:hypothetical protein